MSERVTDEMVKRAALAVSDQLGCGEQDDRGRGCERCREIAHAALAAARIETGEVADERDELRARVAELEAEVESWQTRWTVDGARADELERAIRLHRATIREAGPLTGEFTSEDRKRMARKARADLALWALLPDAASDK